MGAAGLLAFLLAVGCAAPGNGPGDPAAEKPAAGEPGAGETGAVLVPDPDEDRTEEPEPVPHPVTSEGPEGAVVRGGQVRRCAVIVGDDTLGVGPQDAQDFEAALRALPEWAPPTGLYRTIFANATKQGVSDAIQALHGQGCVQLVFFYSGHGSNREGDLAPPDEQHDRGHDRDEYLSLRNRHAVPEAAIGNDQRVFDDELGAMLRAWQVANRGSRPVAGSGGRQFVYVYPELLVILHACRSGGFVGGGTDLDVRLLERFEILMGSGENELCRALRPAGGNVPNSVFVGNILDGMSLAAGDRAVTGASLFGGADDETTREARRICRAEGQGGCNQNPRRFTSIPGDGTITLHSP